MIKPSVRFVMEQARVSEQIALSALLPVKSTVTSAAWGLKRDRYTKGFNGNSKPHIYLAQYPISGKSYWRVCATANSELNAEAYIVCSRLNIERRYVKFS